MYTNHSIFGSYIQHLSLFTFLPFIQVYFPLAEKLKIYWHAHGEDSMIHSGLTLQITVLMDINHLTIIKMTFPKLKINRTHDLVNTRICKTQVKSLEQRQAYLENRWIRYSPSHRIKSPSLRHQHHLHVIQTASLPYSNLCNTLKK